MSRRRLDAEMVRRALVPSRGQAQRLIADHRVLVDGAFADKPARMVGPGQNIAVTGDGPEFVSRAGAKLAGALEEFRVDPTGARCLDVGSSTGGFTDCLLQRGAGSVLAVDVGTNQLHEKLRADPRVTVRERTDIRSLDLSSIEKPFDLIVGDLSFISLRLVLEHLVKLAVENGRFVLLIKPQFEAGRAEADRGRGIISDPAIWSRVLTDVLDHAVGLGLLVKGLDVSSVRGTAGNVEFVVYLGADGVGSPDRALLVQQAVDKASGMSRSSVVGTEASPAERTTPGNGEVE